MAKHCFIGSDTHCGHRVGLTPTSFNHIPEETAEHHTIKQYQQRKILWEWFDQEIKQCKRFDWALWNGDLIDGENAKSGGVELIYPSRKDQVSMAIKVVKTVNAKKNDFIYGTPYHAGNREDFEDDVAKEFSSNIQSEGHFDVSEGLILVAKHFIGNSSSPVSQTTAITSAIIKQMLWAELEQQPKANLIIRSHIHKCIGVSNPAMNKAGWVTPALQGLGSRYGSRQYDGLPVTFGFLELNVESLDRWGIVAHICPLSYQKATVVKV